MVNLGTRIATEARTWINTPFQHLGRQKGLGVDCAGLVLGVWRALGLTTYEVPAYGRNVAPDLIEREIAQFCDRVEGEPAAGDVLVILTAEHPIHMGFATGEGTFIHAWDVRSVRKVVEMRIDAFWQKRLAAVYRWREEP